MIQALVGAIAGAVLGVILSTIGIYLTYTFPHTEDWVSGAVFLVTWMFAIIAGAVIGFLAVRSWQLIYRRRAILIGVGGGVLLTLMYPVLTLFL